MTDFILPPWLVPNEASWKLIDLTGRFRNPMGGSMRTVDRGQRLGCTLHFTSRSGQERAALIALQAALRGGANRLWVADASTPLRGSFPGTEMFANSTFADGTTGWTSSGGAALSFTVADRKAKLTPTGFAQPGIYQQPTFTQGVPYAVRSHLADGDQSEGLLVGRFLSDAGSTLVASDYAAARGLGTLAFVAGATGVGTAWAYVMAATNGYTPNRLTTYAAYTSLQRCALADAASNLLTYSNTGANAAWGKAFCTSGDNGSAGPDGVTGTGLGAQYILEDTTNDQHYVTQVTSGLSAGEADYSFSVSLHAAVRTWAVVQLGEATTPSFVAVWINLSTGAVGTVSGAAGWANVRAYSVSEGAGWYRLTVVARKTTVSTSVQTAIGSATADGSLSFAGGGGSSAHVLWSDASLARSSVPIKRTRTTSAAAAGSISAGASAVNVKGLPASTNGLVLAGDRVEINGEMKIATSDLNSDAAGLGYLQFEPVLRSAPADNAPVIIGEPLCKMIMMDSAEIPSRPHFRGQPMSDFVFSLEEAA